MNDHTTTVWDVRLEYPDTAHSTNRVGSCLGIDTEAHAREWAAHMVKVGAVTTCTITQRQG